MSAQPDQAEDGAEPDLTALPSPADAARDPLAPRQVLLHRRVVKITPARIEIGPPRSALILPAIGFGLTSFLLATLVVWTDSLPSFLLPVLLLVSVVLLPLSGMGLVYGVFGSNVVATRAGHNVSFKQRFLGLGVGTSELVPFWKIREFVVEDVARARRHAVGDEPALEIAQWELTLIKKSGKRLTIGGFNVPRDREEEGLDLVMDVAEALAAMSDAPIRGPIW